MKRAFSAIPALIFVFLVQRSALSLSLPQRGRGYSYPLPLGEGGQRPGEGLPRHP
ncbi:MAG: hypothetical protein WCD00_12260 [Desulfuromonadaceae bacterium]